MSPLGKRKHNLLWESFHILSHTEILSHWEGCQISLHFSLEENSSGPWAILAQFCSYSFQSIHTCLCVTSLSLLDCNPKMWKWGKEQQALHELEGPRWRWPSAVTGCLACSYPEQWSHLPSSSATLPLEAGKLIFLLVLSALPKCISCMKMWDRFLSNTYTQ